MPKPLSAQTVEIVKSTAPVLAVHGVAVTTAMYERLFKDEHIRDLFNHSNQGKDGAQVHALAGAILAYAQNIDNLGVLLPTVERIAQKHIGYNILPEHYPFVARALMGALADVLGDALTADITNAWGEAYWFLADILQEREAVIRGEIDAADGGWTGWREFVVASKERESSTVQSFLLLPRDGKSVIAHKAGQYLTLHIERDGRGALKRNYSISSAANGKGYRISVKREPQGEASQWLHDHVSVGGSVLLAPPAGEFFLPDRPARPVVLFSGGIGLTPMVSMAETIIERHPDLETHFVHGTLNSETHALGAHVRDLATKHKNLAVSVFYSAPVAADATGVSHDLDGFVTLDWLRANTPLAGADYYLCGPLPFLSTYIRALKEAGVPSDQVHYEFFGPTKELLAA